MMDVTWTTARHLSSVDGVRLRMEQMPPSFMLTSLQPLAGTSNTSGDMVSLGLSVDPISIDGTEKGKNIVT